MPKAPQLGNASVEVTASGDTLVTVQAEGIPEGIHGIHLHMVGACDGPTFESAGGHIAGDMDHGIRVANGPHPGDLPNVQAGSDGVRDLRGLRHRPDDRDAVRRRRQRARHPRRARRLHVAALGRLGRPHRLRGDRPRHRRDDVEDEPRTPRAADAAPAAQCDQGSRRAVAKFSP